MQVDIHPEYRWTCPTCQSVERLAYMPFPEEFLTCSKCADLFECGEILDGCRPEEIKDGTGQ